MRSASLILPLVWAVTILWSASIFWSTGVVFAAGETANVRNVLIEVYVAKETQTGATVVETVQKIASERGGIQVVVRDVTSAPNNRDRLKKIADHYSLPADVVPVVYGCNRVISGVSDPKEIAEQIDRMLTMEVFVREGCSRCAAAEEILPGLLTNYPGLRLVFRSVNSDPTAVADMNALVKKHKMAAASTPTISFCNTLHIGFDRSSSSSERIRKTLERWTVEVPDNTKNKGSEVAPSAPFSPR
ncbi:MAG: hypothetical protein MUF23_05965 [Pirellula sp.]|nr:hypothetical protein [Pirellula sp.]